MSIIWSHRGLKSGHLKGVQVDRGHRCCEEDVRRLHNGGQQRLDEAVAQLARNRDQAQEAEEDVCSSQHGQER